MTDMNSIHLQEPSTVASMLHQQSQLYANHVAILSPDKPSLSYRQLYQQVKRCVSVLQQAGIGRHDRVAVVLPNGADMAVALLSVTSTASCAPLNPSCQAPELRFYCQDLGVKAVLVAAHDQTAASQVAAELGLTMIKLTPLDAEAGVFELASEYDEPTEQDAPGSQDIALLLHTSGTTSMPKLVPLTQQNLMKSVKNICAKLKLDGAIEYYF